MLARRLGHRSGHQERSLTPWRMTWSSAPWHTTPTCRGSGCTSRGGFVLRCNGRTGPWSTDEGHAARRCRQSAAGQPLPALRVRRVDAADVSERPVRAVRGRCHRPLQERGTGPGSAAGDPGSVRSSAVWSFIRRRPRSSTARTTIGRRGTSTIAFDFLGYTFQPRRAKNRRGKFFVSFLPAISAKAAKAIRATIREWRMASTRNNQRLEDLARLVNPVVRGWMNYYGRFYRSKCVQVAAASQRGPRRMGATEVQAVSSSRARVDALAGTHRATGPQAVRPVATRRETGGWIVGAG